MFFAWYSLNHSFLENGQSVGLTEWVFVSTAVTLYSVSVLIRMTGPIFLDIECISSFVVRHDFSDFLIIHWEWNSHWSPYFILLKKSSKFLCYENLTVNFDFHFTFTAIKICFWFYDFRTLPTMLNLEKFVTHQLLQQKRQKSAIKKVRTPLFFIWQCFATDSILVPNESIFLEGSFST